MWRVIGVGPVETKIEDKKAIKEGVSAYNN